MVGASKILTVSYGTFSCTLEGFDDSFETMKAIAEYFRELAAEDRYFGAEPPTPDAEMLQRIAEREVRKRVDARIGNDGVVLRPAALPDAATPAPAPQPPTASHDAGAAASETVAAKLARIRAVVEHARAAAPAEPADSDISNPFTMPPTPEPAVSPAAEATDQSVETVSTDTDTPLPEAPQAAFAPSPDAVERDHPETADGDDTEPSVTEQAETETMAETVEPAADDAPAMAEAAPSDAEAAAPDEDEIATTVAAVEATEDTDAAEAEPPQIAAEDEATPDADPKGAGDLSTARILSALGDKAPDAPAESKATVNAAARRARARVLKLRRDDLAKSLAPANPPHPPKRPELENEAPEETPSLQSKPDTIRAETESRKSDAAPAATGEPLADHAQPHKSARLQGPGLEEEEVALQRLLDETNTKLEGPEQQRRRASIAHLKAAVAATFADRKMGSETSAARDEDQKRPYRQVLAKVVRGDEQDETEIKEGRGDRLPPLMLASEQRVDAAGPDPRTEQKSLKSGGDATQAVAPDEDDGDNIFAATISFADFAADRGASDMPQYLESAAAYVLSVEGKEHFSRADVMRLAIGELGDDVSREDLLRAFGGLLREGVFIKLRRGEFILATQKDDAPEEQSRRMG